MSKLLPSVPATVQNKLAEPGAFQDLIRSILNGRSPLQWCAPRSIQFADLMSWIRDSPERAEVYDQALRDRNEWVREAILKEMRTLALTRVTDIFEEDGITLKPVVDWPEDFAASVSSMEIEEKRSGTGISAVVVGYIRKIKFWPKDKALEMLAKHLDLFQDLRVKHDVEGTLEDLILGSRELDKQIEARVIDTESEEMPPPDRDESDPI